MRPSPIFDTNIFGHVQDGLIPESDWRFLLRHRPGRGWPLSNVTALELLAGAHDIPSQKFPKLKEQVELAHRLSNGRILEDPRLLLCREVLRVPLPRELVPFAGALSRHMDVVRRARSLIEIREARVPYKQLLTRGKGRAGFEPAVVKDLVASPKKQWEERVEALATSNYPQWGELFQKTGKRLPEGLRRELEASSAWEAQRDNFSKSILEWLGADTGAESVVEIKKRLDAVLEFTIFVAREFLIGNYPLAKRQSDVYDQFQLHYLAMDRFVIVSADSDLSKRTFRSCQADRIMSFSQFLKTL